MKTQPVAITDTLLFRLAQLVLPEGLMLALFGRRVRVAVGSTARGMRGRAPRY